MRVAIIYLWRHGRWPLLHRPERFTEWVQWRKLNGAAHGLELLTDKLHSKSVAAQRGGRHYCIPTLWSGTRLPDTCPAPYPVIVKTNHGCNQNRIVRCDADWLAVRRIAPRWMASAYGGWLDESAYRSARRLLLIEPFLAGPAGGRPDDYKVYVFRGRAAMVQRHVGRGGDHRWTQFDRDWVRVGGADIAVQPPTTLPAMLEAAERLGAGHDFIRVDFYEVDGKLWFGEFCLYPGSGLDPFDPPELDLALGRLWAGKGTA
ncbi:polysaccharide biosynthesis protein [Sphingomonas sabuli]|uniref:Polysaccharide biosynthesis protein n=2 Tax=Sphingomonas sabuli TaxID=2764186 RepID=A0A7G9L663_9SPHN|nr:polysaccharide biosynthesis protein [Sphingomonas sabuli]